MTTKLKVPKIRFKEFSGEWEDNIFGNIAKFSKGKGISKEDIVENGYLECIRYGELYTTYGETIKNIKSKTNLDKNGLILSEYNDIIIPASGETQIDIATASCVLKDGVALGGDLNIIKTKNDGIFLSYYLNNKKKLDIAKLSQGISVVHLYSSQLQTLELNLPTLPEQQKIASFLGSIDEKIEKIKEKKKSLEEYKKGVMQKIFSQELRFKNENGEEFGEWEEKKLGDLAKITTGSSNREDSNLDGEYTFFDRSEDIRTSNIYLFDCEAIIVAGEGQRFMPKYFVGKFDLHQRSYAIMNFKDLNGKFLYYYIIQNQNYFLSQAVGSTVKSLRLPMFQKMIINLPTLKEQEKIADFLGNIDEKIEKIIEELGKMEEFKKGLLQGVFM